MPNISIVTGGCGFLGRHVVDQLISEGRRVVVFDDYSTPGAMQPHSDHVRMVPCNLAAQIDPSHVLSANTLGEEVEEIWHLASPASPPIYKRRRIETLRLGGDVLDRILSWSLGHGARVLFASSSEIYGDPDTETQQEDQPSRIKPVGPRSMYDAAKVYGEALCAAWSHERGADTRIVRIFNSYGPGQSGRDGRLVPAMVRAALDGGVFCIHGGGQQTRTLGYVDDTVAGMFAVMRSSPEFNAVPVNVGGTWTISVLDLVDVVRSAVGPFQITWGERQDLDDPRRRCPDLTRLRGLGWEPKVGLIEGIRRTAKWMQIYGD
jgi:dTDP-glucose 4,6-dehydratase